MAAELVRWSNGCWVLAGLMAVVFFGAVMVRAEVPPEGEPPFLGHPADVDANWRLVMSEAIAYLAGWQQGSNPLGHAIRAAYLWQNGEVYAYDAAQDPPLCWILPPPVEGEDEGEGEGEGEGEPPMEGEGEGEGEPPMEGEGEGEVEGELPMEGEPVVVPPELLDVPAGTFQMGDPWNEGLGDEVPVHAVTLDAYRIGKYEVTNQEYADVLNWAHGRGYLTDLAGDPYTGGIIYYHNQPLADTETSASYSQITYSDGVFGVRSRESHSGVIYSMENHPVVRVSWYGAVCYCNWLSEQQGLQACYSTITWARYAPVRNGYRLPTEAEWERAAAWDGVKHWRYGVSNDAIDITLVNFDDDNGSPNPLGLESRPYTSPVGWYNGINPVWANVPGILTVNATSPIGAYDMTGNVYEWCHDWHSYTYYSASPDSNPTGPTSGSYRLARGGDWENDADECRAAHRGGYDPYVLYRNYGFRLAVSVSSR